MGGMGKLATTAVALLCLVALLAAGTEAKAAREVKQLQIGVKFKPEQCDRKAANGDQVKVHYRGTLVDGSQFDASYDRGEPLSFTLGQAQVIQGWDQGILGMCIGEKRKLQIPAHLGYGDRGAPPKIPGGATLIFDTELVDIVNKASDGVEDDEDQAMDEEDEF
eukprot:jgi/Chlat1/7861/Chrsp66S07291